MGLWGWSSSQKAFRSAANCSRDSPSKTTALARRPWRKLLRADLRLPSGVTGPWVLAPLARDAAICLSVRLSAGMVVEFELFGLLVGKLAWRGRGFRGGFL